MFHLPYLYNIFKTGDIVNRIARKNEYIINMFSWKIQKQNFSSWKIAMYQKLVSQYIFKRYLFRPLYIYC